MLEAARVSVVQETSLLTTMAIMKANYDVERDYLANFEPFALDCVKHWPVGESVKPERLREQLCSRFALPEIPINTAQDLRNRLHRDGYLTRRSGPRRQLAFVPDPERLRGVPDLGAARETALARMRELQDALCCFANRHGSSWSDARGEQALETYVQEFSAELALSCRAKALTIDTRRARADVAIVHAFVRTVVRGHARLLDFLEDMVKGSMLVNVLYFQGLGDWKTRLPALEVYLDTGVLLRALGLAPSEQRAAACELVRLARSFDISLRAFRHTVEEIEGVLEGVAERLGTATQSHVRPTDLIHVNREVLDHLIAQGWKAVGVHAFAADLPGKLRELGVQIVETPGRPARPDIDEAALERTVERVVRGQAPSARLKDVESLVGVHVLRRGRDCRTLEGTPAVFVTSNAAVVRASAAYFEESRLEGRTRHCLSDVSLTTQLWVRKPEHSPQIARKLLIAESCAALALGPPGLYDRYLEAIEEQMDAGELTDEQVKLLVLRMETREPLLDVTHGDAEAVTGETPGEVLERFEQHLLSAADRRVDATIESLRETERENHMLASRLRQQQKTAATPRADLDTKEVAMHVMRAIGPGLLMIVIGMAVLAGTVELGTTGAVRGLIPVTTLVLGALALVYCGALLMVGQPPRVHSRRWHVALFALVPVGCGIAAWIGQESATWWIAAIAFVSGVFGVLYAIYAFRAPSGQPAD